MEIVRIEKPNWYADYIVQWRPLDSCNYDCSYCSPDNHKPINKKNMSTVEELIFAAEKIKNSVDKEKSIITIITGGEPFLIPNIYKWFDYMSANNFSIVVFTNGSLPLKFYEKCKNSFKNLNIKISYHPENSNIDQIVNLATMIQSNGGNVEVRGMLVHSLFDKVLDLESKLLEKQIKLIKLPVYPLYNKTTKIVNPPFASSRKLKNYSQKVDDGSLNYFSKKELEFLKNIEKEETLPGYLDINIVNDNQLLVPYNSAKIIYNNLNKFTKWKCGVTNKKILIQANGDVQYGVCGNDGIVGNIFSDECKLFDKEFTICNQQECHVIDEIMITKFI